MSDLIDEIIRLAPIIGGWGFFVAMCVTVIFSGFYVIVPAFRSVLDKINSHRFDKQLKEFLDDATNTAQEV